MRNSKANALSEFCARYDIVYVYLDRRDSDTVPNGRSCLKLSADRVTSINERGFTAQLLEHGRRFDARVGWASVYAIHDGDVGDAVQWFDDEKVSGRGDELAELRHTLLHGSVEEPVSGVVTKLPAGWRLHTRAASG